MRASASPTSDDVGTVVDVPAEVRRVVSLVPSLTETVARSAAGRLVGATDWCTEPADLDVTRVRGTKNPDLDAVIRLSPDLVLANDEENRPADVAALRAAGIPVWVTQVRTVPGAMISLARVLRACGVDRPTWLDRAEQVWREPYAGPRRRAFVPIWRRPWMCLGRDTFAGDVLERLGVDNAFGEHAERYPRVSLDDAHGLGIEVVVLPDEPYPFTPEEGRAVFGSWQVPVVCVPGRLVTWYGPSMVEARAELSALLGPQW